MEKQEAQSVIFTEQQLVGFGTYLLSAERKKLFKSRKIKGSSLADRLSQVHDSDLENFKNKYII